MHIETFLYMLLQSDKTVPPLGVTPDFEALARQAHAHSSPNRWVTVPSRVVTLGQNETNGWGWDNEKPTRTHTVPSFEAKSHPVTNGDYAKYLIESGSQAYPKSWTMEVSTQHAVAGDKPEDLIDGYSDAIGKDFLDGKAVRTVYGPVPLILALDWPVMGSYDQLALCADWMGGRIPTWAEARSIYDRSEKLKATAKGTKKASNNTLYADLTGCNVGFRNFHPTPVALQEEPLAGQGGMSGVWEWTSTTLTKWEGFEPMEEYPAYTGMFTVLAEEAHTNLRCVQWISSMASTTLSLVAPGLRTLG